MNNTEVRSLSTTSFANSLKNIIISIRKIAYKFFKRTIDIIAGLVGLVLLIPLSLIIKLICLKEGDKQSIFFTQERIGKGGKPIRIYKYRSMVPNAEQILEELMEKDPEIKKEYLTNKKLKNDPRITKIGKLIRKTSIDEMPQLLNVLKGDMSLIGPRPYLYREKTDIGDYLKYIIAFKPGVTGMWQSHGRSACLFEERLKFDEFYYKNMSMKLDIKIFFLTFTKVFKKDGAL